MSKEQDILREFLYDWRRESGALQLRDTVVAHVHDDSLFVITRHPGLYIGKGGSLVEKYTVRCRKEGIAERIKFVDIGTSYVHTF